MNELQGEAFLSVATKDKLWGHSASSRDVLENNYRRVVVDVMRLFIACKIPVTLWGPVGARKTRTVEALAREKDANGVPFQVISIQPSTEDPTIFHGMMYIMDDQATGQTIMKRSVPDVAQRIMDYHEECGGYTVLFLDEMTTCIPTQQHALLGMMTHGKYGPIDTHEFATIVMAANPENTVSTVHPLGEAVMNRGAHLSWYGDMKLYLEEWRTGFGRLQNAPDSDVDWYVSTLMEEAPDEVFRNRNNWEPDDLVPYGMMEHTERIVTEHARIVSFILDTFGDSPDYVRHHYLIQVTRAMMGPEWGDRMASVCDKEKDRVSADKALELVSTLGVDESWNIDALHEQVGERLYVHDRQKKLRHDQINSVASDIMNHVEHGEDKRSAYLAMWTFAMTAPNEEIQAMMHLHLVKLVLLGFAASKEGELDKAVIVPQFVPSDVKTSILTSIKRQG